MYILKRKALQIPFNFITYQQMAEEVALINSGTTENFINYRTVAQLQLGTQKLPKPRKVLNVDGTQNKAELIEHCIHLFVKQGNKQTKFPFFVTNLGKDFIILGYPWLEEFNLTIDWGQGQVKSPKTQIKTTSAVGREHEQEAY